jgi:hypothetical protein
MHIRLDRVRKKPLIAPARKTSPILFEPFIFGNNLFFCL